MQTDPEDLNLVLSVRSPLPTKLSAVDVANIYLQLWYLRVSSLARLRLFNQTSAEITNLFTGLAAAPPAARTHVFENILPFELEVLRARVKYWSGDPLGYLDALGALLRKCKRKARAARGERGAGDRQMWMERGARASLIVASQFIEMKVITVFTDTSRIPISCSLY